MTDCCLTIRTHKPCPAVIRCIDFNDGNLIWERGANRSVDHQAMQMEVSDDYVYVLIRTVRPDQPFGRYWWIVRVYDKLTGDVIYTTPKEDELLAESCVLLVDASTGKFRMDAPPAAGINIRTVWRVDPFTAEKATQTGGIHRTIGYLGDGVFVSLNVDGHATYAENYDSSLQWTASNDDLPEEYISPYDTVWLVPDVYEYSGFLHAFFADTKSGALVGAGQLRGTFSPLEDEIFDCELAATILPDDPVDITVEYDSPANYKYFTDFEFLASPPPSSEMFPSGNCFELVSSEGYVRLTGYKESTGSSGNYKITLDRDLFYYSERYEAEGELIGLGPISVFLDGEPLSFPYVSYTPVDPNVYLSPVPPKTGWPHYLAHSADSESVSGGWPDEGWIGGRNRDVTVSVFGSDVFVGVTSAPAGFATNVPGTFVGEVITRVRTPNGAADLVKSVVPFGLSSADVTAHRTKIIGADRFLPIDISSRSTWHRFRGHGGLELGRFHRRNTLSWKPVEAWDQYRIAIGKLDQSIAYPYKRVLIDGFNRINLGSSGPISIDPETGVVLHYDTVTDEFYLFEPALGDEEDELSDVDYEPENLGLKEQLELAFGGEVQIRPNGVTHKAMHNSSVIAWPVLAGGEEWYAIIDREDFSVLRFLRYKPGLHYAEAFLTDDHLYLIGSPLSEEYN